MSDTGVSYIDSAGKRTALVRLSESHLGLSDTGNLSELVKNILGDGISSFEFDLRDLNSLNSAGIGVLIGCRKVITAAAGSLKLINVSDKIREIFRLTKIDSLFGVS